MHAKEIQAVAVPRLRNGTRPQTQRDENRHGHAFVNRSQSLQLYGRHLAGEPLQSRLFRIVVGQD